MRPVIIVYHRRALRVSQESHTILYDMPCMMPIHIYRLRQPGTDQHEVVLGIKDLDKAITEDDIVKALQRELPKSAAFTGKEKVVRLVGRVYGYKQTVVI